MQTLCQKIFLGLALKFLQVGTIHLMKEQRMKKTYGPALKFSGAGSIHRQTRFVH